MTNSTACTSCGDNPYSYQPSFAGAFILAALFTLVGVWHLYQYVKHRAWFLYFVLLGIAMEALGFWARTYSSKNLKSFGAYVISYFLIMLAPSVLAAGLYQTFGRMMYYTVPPSHRTFRTLLLPPRFIAPFFVIFDVVSFFIQMIGIGIVVSNIKNKNTSNQSKGINILRVGLILQTLVFGAFAILSARIVLISRRWQFAWLDDGKWRRLGWVVSAGSFLITFRALYRIFEFTINSGQNYLNDHEWPAFVFDALVMLFLIASFSYYHPGKYLPQSHTSLHHAYKRLGNAGNRSPDPRFKGVELDQRGPQIAVQQPVESRDWAQPQQYQYPPALSREYGWGARPPGGMHMGGGNVYMPAKGYE